MKKVIALALAMAMAASMSSMALGFQIENDAHNGNAAGGAMYPGEEYHFTVTLPNNPANIYDGPIYEGDEITDLTDAFRISASWDVGSALIDSVKLDSDCNHIVVKIKENYTIEDAKDVEGTITLTAKDDIYYPASAAVNIEKGEKLTVGFTGTVANDVEDVDGASKKDDATTIDVADNTIYNMTESGWVEFCGDGNRLSSVLVRLPEGKQVFAYFNEDMIDEIEDKYYDLDADISYINFVAKPNLGQKAEIAIQGDYSDKYYLYEYTGGELVEIKDADWKEDDGLFEFTASKLGSYVISDKALVAEADEEPADEAVEDTTSKNPDTGANDVVGVAVALAAVSLVAAGAVSLKK